MWSFGEALLALTGAATILSVAYAMGRNHSATYTAKDGPICGCGHHFAYHEKDAGPCHATDFLGGGRHAADSEACRCQQYTGPVYFESLLP